MQAAAEKPAPDVPGLTSITLNQMIDETAARAPDAVATVAAASTLTFSQLKERIMKAAAAFHSRGVRKGDCVCIVLRNSPEFIIAYFGLNRLGATAVPLNFMIQKAEELRFMINDCKAVGIVTQKEFLKGLTEARKTLPAVKSMWSTDGEDKAGGVESFQDFVAAGDASKVPSVPVGSTDTAAILYTSGTTGSPKGAMLSHGNLVSNCDASIKQIGVVEKDVMLTILPMFHTFAWTACVLIPLRLGIKNVISSSITPAKPWLSMMGRHGVTVFAAVPPVYNVLAREVSGLKGLVLKYWFFRKVRFCVTGSAPLSTDVAKAFESAMGLPMLEGYGLTETSPVVTINPPHDRRLGSVGVAIPDVHIRIIRDDETELPLGEEGEIAVKGPNVMQGYLGRPDATRECFTKDGWFKTGDIGLLDKDGYLYLRDRKKDMIIIKGLKVFSAQVEQVIAAHPDVEEVAIVGIPDEAADEVIKAFIVPKKGSQPDKAALMQYCRQKLDAYKRPRDIELVESLPKNALQKVLKRVLRQKELDKRK